MSLAMIYGRSGSGKTTELFRRLWKSLKADDDFTKKRYVLVPDQFSYMMEKKILAEFGERYVFAIQVVGFRMLAQRILERVGGIKKPLLSPVGRSMLISSLALKNKDKLKLYRTSAGYAGFAELASDTIREFKNYAIVPQELKEACEKLPESELKNKLQDVALLFEAYETELHENFVDAEDQLDTAIEKLKGSDFLKGAEFYFDEFSDFTPKQLEMIGVLLKKGPVFITLNYEEGLDEKYNGVFSLTRDTDAQLMAVVRDAGVSLEKPLFLKGPGRFRDNPELAHLEREFYHYPNNTYAGEVRTVQLYRALNPYEEIEFVARDIVERVREGGLRYRDIAILLRDLDTYGATLQSIMKQYGIPVFIDARKEIDTNPLAALISGFFEIQRRNFQFEAVFKYLKTQLLGVPQAELDALENYCLANGITGWRWTEEVWTYPVPDVRKELEANKLLNNLNELKDLVVNPMVRAFEELEQADNVRTMARILYEFLVNTGVLDVFIRWTDEFKESDSERYREYSQILDSLMLILDQMVEAMGDEKMTIADFGNTLLVGLSSIKISLIPATLDQVIVGDIARVRSGGVTGIYIVGANDGVLPRTPSSAGIFTDSDRELLAEAELALSKDARTRAFYEQFYVYNALTIGQDFLTVTYPTSDAEGKSLRPSMIIGRLKKIFPELREEISQSYLEKGSPGRDSITSEREAFRELIGQMRRHHDGVFVDPVWQEVYSRFRTRDEFKDRLETVRKGLSYTNYPAELKVEHMDELYGKNLTLSVSKLESYNRCPFAYFVKYGLKAQERREFILKTPDVGNLMHDVLDRFTKRIKEENLDWKNITPDYTRRSVDELMDRTLEAMSNPILTSSKRYSYMAKKIKRIIAASVDVIKEQIVRGDFEPLYTELEFGRHAAIPAIVLAVDEEHKVNIEGRIDRVDVLRDHDKNYIRIIDYKSGARELSLEDIIHGLQMQLLVYLDVILRNAPRILKGQAIPGAVLYFRVTRPIIENGSDMTDEELETSVLKELRLKGLILEDARIVRSMDKTMEEISLVIPAKVKGDAVSASGNQSNLIVTEEQFEKLREYNTQIIRQVCTGLIQGNISITPVKNKDIAACTYCDYRSICQFDPSQKGNDYKKIRKLKPEEAWLIIDKGGEDHAEVD